MSQANQAVIRLAQPAKSVGGYRIHSVLGEGAFGKVFLGDHAETGRLVALKFIDLQLITKNNLQEYVDREIAILRQMKHPHIIRLFAVIKTSFGWYLVTDLAPNGELFDKIISSRRFDEKTARMYFQQLISAVHYLHTHDVVHRDLKAENLLLGSSMELKLCDFGLSRFVQTGPFGDHPIVFHSLAGSIDYLAPEVLHSEDHGYHGFSCDVWSCGVLLYFMLCGRLPFTARREAETKERILAGTLPPDAATKIPAGAMPLLMKLLTVDPNKRATTRDIIADEWFRVDLKSSLFPDALPVVTPTVPTFEDLSMTQNITKLAVQDVTTMDDMALDEEKLKAAFDSVNVSHNGKMSVAEVRDMLIKLHDGEAVTAEEVEEFMSHFDRDEEGCIGQEQFIVGWIRHKGHWDGQIQLARLINLFHYDLEKELLQSLRTAFDALDVDHSGLLTAANFSKLEKELRLHSKDEAAEIVEAFDAGGKGVTFEKFVIFCTQKNLLRNHPIARRLTFMSEMYDVSEAVGLKTYLNGGFVVSGLRDVVAEKVRRRAAEIHTTFDAPKGSEVDFIQGSATDPITGRTVLRVGVRMLPAVAGYTKVAAYRISGPTGAFHEWFRQFRTVLKDEILQCEDDLAIVGESELM